MLESQLYEDNAFVTLTYEEKKLRCVVGSGLPTLEPKDVQDWLKRLRKAFAPSRLRFYLVGEYGDETWRPHYHAALFGFPVCARGRTLRRSGSGRPLWSECCAACKLVGETWGFGDIDVGVLEVSSAQYVAGYVTKKMTMNYDDRLLGRHPEFARMSNRPGIGHDFLHEVASSMLQFNLDQRSGDVPVTLRHGSRELPLGRYLRMKLRRLIGRDEKTPEEVLAIIKEELRPVREAAFDASKSYASALAEVNAPRVARFHARQGVFKKRREL